MKTVHLIPNRRNALLALARYYWLVQEQFLRLGISSNKGNLSARVLQPLEEAGLIKAGYISNYRPYCLTKLGAEYAALELSVPFVPYPVKGPQFERDLLHRVGTIDCAIAAYQWAEATGATISRHLGYYQGSGAQKGEFKYKPATAHELANHTPFESDLEMLITFPDNTHRLFAVEFHNGTHVSGIVDQLTIHLHAIHQGVISDAFSYPNSNYLLSVYQHEHVLQGVIERLRQHPLFLEFQPLFLFNTLHRVRDSFAYGWGHFDGHPANLF